MFEQVIVHRNPFNPNDTKTVSRLHEENLHKVESFVHHPTSLKPVMFLECSCGFSGLVPVSTETDSEGNIEPSLCPNCKSPTVHEDHVTSLPTTIIHFKDGTSHTMEAKPEDFFKPQAVTPVVVTTKEDISKMIDEKFSGVLAKMDQLISSLQVSKQVLVPVPVEEVKTSA